MQLYYVTAVGDLGRETQKEKVPLKCEEGKWPQRPNTSRTSKLSAGNTQISEARSEISVKSGIHECSS